jgi:hypothetical protein
VAATLASGAAEDARDAPDFHQAIRLQDDNAMRQTDLPHRLYVIDEKQKLERDIERHHALLKLVTDERAITTINQLLREKQDLLEDHLRRTLPKLLRSGCQFRTASSTAIITTFFATARVAPAGPR